MKKHNPEDRETLDLLRLQGRLEKERCRSVAGLCQERKAVTTQHKAIQTPPQPLLLLYMGPDATWAPERDPIHPPRVLESQLPPKA